MDNPIAFSRLLTADCLGQVSNQYQTLPYKIFFEDEEGDFINDNEELRTLDQDPNSYKSQVQSKELNLRSSPLNQHFRTLEDELEDSISGISELSTNGNSACSGG